MKFQATHEQKRAMIRKQIAMARGIVNLYYASIFEKSEQWKMYLEEASKTDVAFRGYFLAALRYSGVKEKHLKRVIDEGLQFAFITLSEEEAQKMYLDFIKNCNI